MTRRQWLILGSLALVVIALLIALMYVLLTAPSGTSELLPSPLPRETFELPVAAVTARSAYGLAQETALKWQGDAYLVSASASWLNTTLDLFREPVPWAFQFYSPSAGQLQVLSISGGEAKVLRESFAAYVLPAVSTEAWPIDSPQALAAWLNAGGGRFLRTHTLVDVHATLRYDKEKAQVMWFVTGLESEGDKFFPHSVEAGP